MWGCYCLLSVTTDGMMSHAEEKQFRSHPCLVQNSLTVDGHFLLSMFSVLTPPGGGILQSILEELEVSSTEGTYKPLNGVLWCIELFTHLCTWHQQHPPPPCFISPSCLLLSFSSLETPSRLCWAFSSFRHPRPHTSFSACSSGARWSHQHHLHWGFCCFEWNNEGFKSSHLHLQQHSM